MEGTGNLYVELWISLASLLRSYTAAHGLNGNRQATVELSEDRIVVRRGDCSLDLQRQGSIVAWTRENGNSGTLEMTEAGRLRSYTPTLSAKNAERMGHGAVDSQSQNREPGHPVFSEDEEEMDIVAEAWAREMMR